MAEDNPAWRETADKEVPFFLSAAMTSAGCQSVFLMCMVFSLLYLTDYSEFEKSERIITIQCEA
ncbi:hypothetical protein DZJ_01010 [Dickeya ananatis]